ncbi:putative organic cation transporter protein-like isoform X4 [Penaeus vannamei]|uniref:Putative organic cation transporter protein-like isoform X4 n=1 Tax=Penaeus vannamei TaxID=6689 RepID=A0A3R7M7A6_PENVA|nr:putative organic cation transporter protein-like isoform X4 [Penaeus vannamei]
MAKRLDDVMSRLGTGRWNLLHISLPLLLLLSDHVPHPGRRLPRPRVDYTCRRPEGAHDAAAARSASPLFIPAGDNTSEEAKPECSYFVLNSSSGQVEEEPCVEWDFDNSTFSSTVGTEVIFDSDRLFQLACGWEYLRSTYQSIYMFGVTIGAPFNGVLADRYGRKMTMAVGFVAYSALAIGSCWIPNLSALLLSRFLMGAVDPTILKTGYIYTRHGGRGSQVAHAYRHCIVSAMGAWSHGVGRVRLPRPGMADASADRVFAVSGLLAYSVFMDESPRWLAVRGQHRRALRVLQRAARWNGVALPRGRASAPAQGRSQGRDARATPREAGSEGTILILLLHHSPTPSHTLAPSPNRTPRLRTITLSLYTNYLLVGAVYFGLSLSGGDLSSDPFLYMVLTGVVELPAYTLVIPLVARYGRRAPVVAFFFMGAVALLALPFVPTGSGESMTLALMGKMSIASAFQILDFYSSELFPTEGPLYPWAPSAVFGAASVLAGLATLALPETLHVPLPDTIAHLEEREIRTRYGRKMTVAVGFVAYSPGHRLLLDPQPLGSPALALSHGRRPPHDTEDGIYTR